jgi:hypothetical protein
LEYDFVVAPGADPRQIKLEFQGVEQLRLDRASGELVLATSAGKQLRHGRPRVYQEIGGRRVEVDGGYHILDRHHATFTLAAHDARRPLVIDPVIGFYAALGGTGGNDSNEAHDVFADAAGSVYLAGIRIH